MPGGTDVEAFKTELFDAAASCVEHSGVQDMCVESAGNLVLLVVAENAENTARRFLRSPNKSVPRRGTFFIGAVSGAAQSGKKGTAPVRGAVFS